MNCFRWILLSILPDRSMVYVFDSLRKEAKEFQPIIDMVNNTWGYFRKNHVGEFKEELYWYHKFSVCVCSHISCHFFQYNIKIT